MTDDEIKRKLQDYIWYHVVKINDRISTPGVLEHVQSQAKTLRALDTIDLDGKRVLDVGCRDGLFSFEAERRRAREVIGIDNDLSRGAVDLLIPLLGSKIRMHEMNILDLSPKTFGVFGVVIFAGVLYHLRYPFWALRLLRDVMAEGGVMILETAIFADENRFPLLYCPTTVDSPYGESSPTLFNLRGLTESLASIGFEAVADELQHGAAYDPAAAFKVIDRVAMVCKKVSGTTKPKLNCYFEGTHDLHSSGASSFE